MNIVVTGGAGFIGSNYLRMLSEGKLEHPSLNKVIVIDKLTYSGNKSNLPKLILNKEFQFIEGDICDFDLIEKSTRDADLIIHFAAESHVDRSINDSSNFVRTNVLGTATLLEASNKNSVSKFLNVSTDEVYGSILSGDWTESSPLEPNSPYSASKASQDLLARAFSKTHSMNVITTRACNNFGPYQHPEKLIPNFITRILTNKSLPIYGSGLNTREWIYVEDHCRAINFLSEASNASGVYNIGTSIEMTNLELTRKLLEYFGLGEDKIEYVKDRKGHDLRYSLNSDKLLALYNFRHSKFDDAFRNTIEWYLTNQNWWKSLI